MTRIISRSEWGARYGDGVGWAQFPATENYLHHSVTLEPDMVLPRDDDYAAIRLLDEIGKNRFGWNYGFPYSFGITPAGLIFEGHHIRKMGAHTYGHNDTARAMCWVGNYENDWPTDQQIEATAWLLQHGYAQGWWTAPRLTGGHRDVYATACPGIHAYNAIDQINALAAGGSVDAGSSTDWPLDPRQYFGPADGPPECIGGWYGPNPHVRRIQQRFQELGHAPGYPAWADGVWEPPTTEACKEWERAAGQPVDGVITENDWNQLFGDDMSAEEVWEYGIESGHKNNPKWKAKNFITNIEADGDQTQTLVRDVLRLVGKRDGITADDVAEALAPKLTTSILPMLGEAVETVLARDNAEEAEATAKAIVNEMSQRLATAR